MSAGKLYVFRQFLAEMFRLFAFLVFSLCLYDLSVGQLIAICDVVTPLNVGDIFEAFLNIGISVLFASIPYAVYMLLKRKRVTNGKNKDDGNNMEAR